MPSSDSLEGLLINYLQRQRSHPRTSSEIARDLGIDSRQRAELRDILRRWEESGKILRLRQSRYTLAASQISDDSPALMGRIRRLSTQGKGKLLFIPDEESRATLRKRMPHLGEEQLRDFLLRDYASGGAQDGDLVQVHIKLRPPRQKHTRRNKNRPQLDDLRADVRVERIIKRRQLLWEGIYDNQKGKFGQVKSEAKHHPPLIRLTQKAPADAIAGMMVLVEPSSFPSEGREAQGHIVEVLGWPDDDGVKMTALIRRYCIRESFPTAVLEETDAISENVSEEEIAQREDWRSRCVITIDPATARDFDDAISVRRHDKGWELAVHIADVSHYVSAGSALDEEAQKRGNSTYLPDRVIPMLPARLCDDICSLRPHVDRLSMLCLMQFDEEGRCYESRCAQAVIRSQHRFDYKEVLDILEGRASCEDPDIATLLREAQQLAALLRKKRFEHGSLDLDMPQLRLIVDDFGRTIDVEQERSDEAHALIEEFMLAANDCVANKLRLANQPTIYRVHEPPFDSKLTELSVLLKQYDINCGHLSSRQELINALEQIKGLRDEVMLKQSVLRSMMRARYSTQALGQYGLNKVDYCHFTSPIRRYADLIVHRSIRRLCQLGYPALPNMEKLQSISEHISETERVSAQAENEALKAKLLQYLYDQSQLDSPRRWVAIIHDTSNMGLFVDIPLLQMKGMVMAATLPDDTRWMFNRSRQSWDSFDGRSYLAGMQVEVIPVRVQLEHGLVDFELC